MEPFVQKVIRQNLTIRNAWKKSTESAVVYVTKFYEVRI